MKKLFLSMGCLLLCLPLAGCSTTSDANVLTTLNNQLDRVESVVSSTSSTEVNAVSPYTINLEKGNLISMYKAEAYANMTNEEEIRQEVLSLNAKLKDTNAKYKLGKRKAVALNSLSSNLSKYLNYLNNTKPEIKNNVAKITKSTTPNSYNEELTKSSYVALSNLMNERIVYLNNIYCSLSQIEDLLDNSKVSQTETVKKDSVSNNIDTSNNCKSNDCAENNTQKSISNYRFFQPNIDTYGNYRKPQPRTNEISQQDNSNMNDRTNSTRKLDDIKETENTSDNSNNNTSISNIDTMQNSNLPQCKTNFSNGVVNNGVMGNAPLLNNGYPYGTMPYAPYGYNGGFGYNGYNGGYGFGYNYRFNRVNPGRNTDTFYPFIRNIDTYRLPPNVNGQGYNGYGINNPMTNGEITPPVQANATDNATNLENDTNKQEKNNFTDSNLTDGNTSNDISIKQNNTNTSLIEKEFKPANEITLYPRRPHLKEVKFDQNEETTEHIKEIESADRKIDDKKLKSSDDREKFSQEKLENKNNSFEKINHQSKERTLQQNNEENLNREPDNNNHIYGKDLAPNADKINLNMSFKNNETNNEEKRHVI